MLCVTEGLGAGSQVGAKGLLSYDRPEDPATSAQWPCWVFVLVGVGVNMSFRETGLVRWAWERRGWGSYLLCSILATCLERDQAGFGGLALAQWQECFLWPAMPAGGSKERRDKGH